MRALPQRASPTSEQQPLPGSSGTPLSAASARAVCFRPKCAHLLGVGPMKTMPAASQRSAKSAFSLRNP